MIIDEYNIKKYENDFIFVENMNTGKAVFCQSLNSAYLIISLAKDMKNNIPVSKKNLTSILDKAALLSGKADVFDDKVRRRYKLKD